MGEAGGLSLRVLGEVSGIRDGAELDLGGPRQRAALALLIAERGGLVSTDRLIDSLWPEPPAKPLVALRAYVSHLRRALEPGAQARERTGLIVSRAPGYALRLPPDTVDAWRFEAAVAHWGPHAATDPAGTRDALGAALALWRGDPYADLADPAWVAPERVRLTELRAQAQEAHAGARLALGEAAVIPDLEAMASAAPLREERWRLLALALYRSGRQADALAALRRARTVLAEELGLDPGPSLREVEAAILAHDPALDAPRPVLAARPPGAPAAQAPAGDAAEGRGRTGSPAAPASGEERGAGTATGRDDAALAGEADPSRLVGRRSEELLGREAEVAALARAGGLALVTGGAGSGKSAVAGQVARLGAERGALVAWGACPEVDGAPALWPWSQILRALDGADAEPALAPLLGEAADPEDAAQGAEGRFRLRQAVVDFLRGRAAHRPLLLVLDDLHRADEGTVELLVHLAGSVGDAPVRLLATCRTAEGAEVLGRIAPHVGVRRELAPLAARDLERLIRRLAGRDLPDAEVAAAAARSEGNPFFARELALLLGSGAALEGPGGVPAGVRDVVRRRVDLLPAQAAAVVRLAAVQGREVDLDVLVDAAGMPEEEALDAVDAALLAGLLDADGAALRFHHVLVQDAVYHQVSPPRRARHHALLARATERLRPDDDAALARHYAAAGPAYRDRACAYAARAAEAAERRYAHAEAAALWRKAVDAAGTSERKVELLLSLVRAQTLRGSLVGMFEARSEAIAVARPTGDPALIARAITAWSLPTLWQNRPHLFFDGALVEEIRALLAQPGLDDERRCRLLCALAGELDGKPGGEAFRAAGEAMELMGDDPELIGLAAAARLRTSFFAVSPEERAEVAGLLRRTGERHGRPALALLGAYAEAQAAFARGETGRVRRRLAEIDRLTAEHHLGSGAVAAVAIRSALASFAGDFAGAERGYDELRRAMRAAGAFSADTLRMIGLVCVREHTGGLGDLRAEVEQIYRMLPQLPSELMVRVVRETEPEAARSIWRPDETLPEDFLALFWQVHRGANAMAFGHAEAAERCYSWLLPHAGVFAGAITSSMTMAPVDHYLGDLAAHLGRPAAAHYAAAEALAVAKGVAHYAERARRALAALAAAGRP